MNIELITLIESIYLYYMYFIYKTNYSFSSALFDKEMNSMGSFFIHDTRHNENKICKLGKVLAIIAICLAWIRVYYIDNCIECNESIRKYTIFFDLMCVLLAGLMNLNALVYIIPLIITEIIIIR